MNKNFIRKIENFVCEKCGEKVIGDGYTDHCPRESGCKGLMKPEYAEYIGGKTRIYYKCLSCGHKFVVRVGKNDDYGKIAEIMR